MQCFYIVLREGGKADEITIIEKKEFFSYYKLK